MKNIFDDIPQDLTSEQFETIVQHRDLKIERIISKGQQSPESGWYDQDTHEWVLVLQGEATLEFEDGASFILKAGDYVMIAPHRRHRVSWTHPVIPTLWLAVHYH